MADNQYKKAHHTSGIISDPMAILRGLSTDDHLSEYRGSTVSESPSDPMDCLSAPRRWKALCSLIALLGIVGCTEAGQTYPITGTVIEVGTDTIVLDHEEIVGFMDAMVMELPVDQSASQVLSPGDRVEGQLVVVPGQSTRLVGLEVVGHTEEKEGSESVVSPLEIGDQLEARTVPVAGGQTVTIGAGQGAVTIVTFLFTTCPLPEYCPLLASKLAQLQGQLDKRARIVAITLDPETDSLDVLAAYGERFGADPEIYHMGRLEIAELTVLLDRVGVRRIPNKGTFMHSLRLLILDSDGRLLWMEKDNSWDVAIIAGKANALVQ